MGTAIAAYPADRVFFYFILFYFHGRGGDISVFHQFLTIKKRWSGIRLGAAAAQRPGPFFSPIKPIPFIRTLFF